MYEDPSANKTVKATRKEYFARTREIAALNKMKMQASHIGNRSSVVEYDKDLVESIKLMNETPYSIITQHCQIIYGV